MFADIFAYSTYRICDVISLHCMYLLYYNGPSTVPEKGKQNDHHDRNLLPASILIIDIHHMAAVCVQERESEPSSRLSWSSKVREFLHHILDFQYSFSPPVQPHSLIRHLSEPPQPRILLALPIILNNHISQCYCSNAQSRRA